MRDRFAIGKCRAFRDSSAFLGASSVNSEPSSLTRDQVTAVERIGRSSGPEGAATFVGPLLEHLLLTIQNSNKRLFGESLPSLRTALLANTTIKAEPLPVKEEEKDELSAEEEDDDHYRRLDEEDKVDDRWMIGPSRGESASSCSTEGSGSSLSREDCQLSELGIPFSSHHIVNSSPEEFLLLQKHFQLTRHQISLCKDIRRRGKNKVAAQNCRKRKQRYLEILVEQVRRLKEHRQAVDLQRQLLLQQQQLWQMRLHNISQRLASQGQTLILNNQPPLTFQGPTVDILEPANQREELVLFRSQPLANQGQACIAKSQRLVSQGQTSVHNNGQQREEGGTEVAIKQEPTVEHQSNDIDNQPETLNNQLLAVSNQFRTSQNLQMLSCNSERPSGGSQLQALHT